MKVTILDALLPFIGGSLIAAPALVIQYRPEPEPIGDCRCHDECYCNAGDCSCEGCPCCEVTP